MFGKDRLIFLLKDPHWTFIWWNITPETLHSIKVQLGDKIIKAKFILRIIDITDLDSDFKVHSHFFDVEVIGCTDHWYLYIPNSNRTYYVEAGFKGECELFYSVARSNSLTLPRDRPSDSWDECWSAIEI